MNPKFIVIDGKKYASLEEMPEDVRRRYESALNTLDKNRNGVPDMLENVNIFFEDKNKDGLPDALEGLAASLTSSAKVVINGRELDSLNDLPPETRAQISQALGKLDANQNGMPDFMEAAANISTPTINKEPSFGMETPPQSQPVSVSPIQNFSTIEPEPTNRWLVIFSAGIIFMLCVATLFGAWYFLLR